MPCRCSLIRWAILWAVSVFFPVLAPAQAPGEPKKVALLVGINDYEGRGFRTLSHAERDAEKLAEQLQKLGFRTVVLTGSQTGDLRATRANLEKQLNRLLTGIKKDDIVLIALSGHGVQLSIQGSEEPYFCPVDAVADDPKTLFSLNHLIDDLLDKKGGRNMVLVDACREAIASKGVQGKNVRLPNNTAVFFGCSAGQRSYESQTLGDGHGLFTYCVLESLKRLGGREKEVTWSGLVHEVEELMADDEVKERVPLGWKQTPLPTGNLERTVLFRKGKPLPPSPLLAEQGLENRGCKLTRSKGVRGAAVVVEVSFPQQAGNQALSDTEEMLAVLPGLRALNLGSTRVTDQGLKSLAPLAKLLELNLSETAVGDVGLKELAGLQQLEVLDLSATRVTDRGLKELAPLRKLRTLKLADTTITGAGLKELPEFAELEWLDLGATRVEGAGLERLARLKGLRTVRLTGCPASEKAVQELKDLVPGLKVIR